MAVKPYRTEEEERAYRYGKNSAALRAEEEKAFRAGKSDAYFQAKAMPLPQIAPKSIPLPQVKTQNAAVPNISAPQTKITMPQFKPIDLETAKRNQLALTANPNASIDDIRRSMDEYRAATGLTGLANEYKEKYPEQPEWISNLSARLDNSRLLNQAQNLMEATNPVASVYRTEKALSDIANKAIHGKTADEPYDIGAAYIRKADEARENFRDESRSKALADVALAAGDMVSAAATGGTLGMGLTPYLATTGGIQTAGEDIERGKGLLPSVLHGVGSGGLTYLVEGLGGIGKTKYGQELLEEIASVPVISKALDAASPQVAKFLGNSLGRVLASAGQEGLEEGIEYPLQVMLENIIFDDATPFSVKEWWNNMVVGGGVGALFGGSNVMANRLAQTTQNPADSPVDNVSGGDILTPLEQSVKQTVARRKAPSENMSKAVEELGRQMRGEAEPNGQQKYIARMMEKYGASEDEVVPMMTGAEYRKYTKLGGTAEPAAAEEMSDDRYTETLAQMDHDFEESVESLLYDIDDQEMKRRARAAAKAPNERTAELLNNAENGIIESGDIDESMTMLADITFAANRTLSENLDRAVQGAKSDLPLMGAQKQQLRQKLYNAIEKPLAEAKAKYVSAVKGKAGSFAKEMERLGIKAGTKESAAVQWIGEGQRQGKDGNVQEYTQADLMAEFPESWPRIEEAARICRQYYDAYVDEINDALKKVYPNVEARAQAEMDRINARVAHNNAQAQLWINQAAELQQRLETAQGIKHREGTKASVKDAQRVNRLQQQMLSAQETADRYTGLAEAARAKAEQLQKQIDSGEILRNKRLIPRKDYFHHFNEMEQGLGGFINIISGAHDISTALAGKSEFTKPKSKWWGALQQRTGGRYTADAVGGMARYIPAAEYKIAFDPYIAQMRGNIEALVNVTEKTKNTNGLIEYLTDWTNDLAGKTNFIDRSSQKMFSRKGMKALEFLNNRAKANAVAGNIGSAIVQIGNIPNAMVFINDPADWVKAGADIVTGNGKEVQSVFLNERYLNNELDKLQNIGPLKKASNWLLEVGDMQAARLIWNAAYNQYESGNAKGLRKYESAVDYADDITRRSIGGRGIGEMALTQKSRITKLLAPFQVEVNNTFNLLTEQMGERNAAGLLRYAAGAWAINSLIYAITGRRPLFDPIDALLEAITAARDEGEEDERTVGERVASAAKRIGGEIASNVPYASTFATLLAGKENSEKIFGENDPTRYGTGNIAVQTLLKPAAQFLNGEKVDLLAPTMAILPSFGGKQIERSVRGAQALGWLPRVDIRSSGVDVDRNEFGASRAASGRVRFPITTPADQLRAVTLGEWSTSRGRRYIDEGLQPLSDKQSEAMEEVFAAGISPDVFYDATIAARGAVSQKDSKGKTIPLSQDKDKVRLIKEAIPGLTAKEYKLIFEALGISKNAY